MIVKLIHQRFQTVFGVLAASSMAAACTAIAAGAPKEVNVPKIGNLSITAAYERLHDDGLLVTIPASTQLANEPLYPVRITPRPGTRVPVKSVVTLRLGCRCGASSIPPQKHRPAYRVPQFIGKRALSPYRWIKGKRLALELSLGPLRRGNAREFLDNFVVVSQVPTARTELRFSTTGGIITPLQVHATQRR